MASPAPGTARHCEFCDKLYRPPKLARGHPSKGHPINTCSDACQRRLEVSNAIRYTLGKESYAHS